MDRDTLLTLIEEELILKPLPMNKYRKNSGEGRSQCFGVVKQRNGTYTASRMNFTRPELYKLLQDYGHKHLPTGFSYTSIQVNQNYQTAPHYDKGNTGDSYIIAFGHFSGGELLLHESDTDAKKVNIHYNPCIFKGHKILHSTAPYEGDRYTLVYHTVDTTLKPYSFSIVNNLFYEKIDNVVRHYNKKGKCIYSSDGVIPSGKARQPICRPVDWEPPTLIGVSGMGHLPARNHLINGTSV